tara:strand:+ start:687 stop:1184 length:498 start_codon:yes stop_codon:yes gene_type:complete
MNKGISLPNYKDIISLEKIANKDGSGIIFDELIGKWKFQYVWKKGKSSIDNISSSLLQVLVASLELSRNESKDDSEMFVIKNSIKFGILSIVFSGEAFLKGNRPLLYFYFKNLYIQISGFNIINKTLKEVELKKMPFFSLIAIDKTKKWLCARGKGGGLAIWIRS